MKWLYRRIRLAVLEYRLAKLQEEHRRVMNVPGATTRWTLDAMYQNAAPIRRLQLEIKDLWDEL